MNTTKRRSRFLGRVLYKSDFVRGTGSDTSSSDGGEEEEEDNDNMGYGERQEGLSVFDQDWKFSSTR